MRVDGRDLSLRRGGHVSHHGQRHVKMTVAVRAPGEAPEFTQRRRFDRAPHRPKMAVGQRHVDGLQPDRFGQLWKIDRHHVRRRRDAGLAAKFGERLEARKVAFGATRVFRVEQFRFQQRGHWTALQTPAAVGIDREPGVRQGVGQGADAVALGGAVEDAAFKLEGREPESIAHREGLFDDGSSIEGFLAAHALPGSSPSAAAA